MILNNIQGLSMIFDEMKFSFKKMHSFSQCLTIKIILKKKTWFVSIYNYCVHNWHRIAHCIHNRCGYYDTSTIYYKKKKILTNYKINDERY